MSDDSIMKGAAQYAVSTQGGIVKISKILIVLFFCSLPLGYVSAEVTELSIDSSTCWLKERGVAIKKNPMSTTGVKNESGCIAFLPKSYISKNF
ncbi:hypothetical protein [Marinobacter sp. LV10R520-4]|uniref:hypothetical protein n=1 Tax=Marinobacter sp. LV10R520-4 TaxID=1761796 RepID=UPI00117F4F25|nr:hypothetical protein [Marinobacter sp. LV10R520-4]